MVELFKDENNNEKITSNDFFDPCDLLGSKGWKGRNIKDEVTEEGQKTQSDIKNVFQKDKGDFL